MTTPIWPVLFDEPNWRTDLAAATGGARDQAIAWRRRITAIGGIPHDHLRRVEQADHPEPLPGCAKTRIPDPHSDDLKTSPWGAVLRADVGADGRARLVFVAFGQRHPEASNSNQPSVYARAARRM